MCLPKKLRRCETTRAKFIQLPVATPPVRDEEALFLTLTFHIDHDLAKLAKAVFANSRLAKLAKLVDEHDPNKCMLGGSPDMMAITSEGDGSPVDWGQALKDAGLPNTGMPNIGIIQVMTNLKMMFPRLEVTIVLCTCKGQRMRQSTPLRSRLN